MYHLSSIIIKIYIFEFQLIFICNKLTIFKEKHQRFVFNVYYCDITKFNSLAAAPFYHLKNFF